MEKQWETCKVLTQTSIRGALHVMDQANLQIVLVVDEENHLLGTVTDGDIRRGLLSNVPQGDPVDCIMNRNPMTVQQGKAREWIARSMREKRLRQVPVIDEERRLVDLILFDDLLDPCVPRSNIVVLMVGGLGTRLRPLTYDCPKPLLKIGEKPILEIILEGFLQYGFHRFYLSVNYKSQMIEDYFGDGRQFGADISYLHEPHRMGTAGALQMLPERPEAPIIVMNGDLLTKVDFSALLEYHSSQKAMATMAVRKYSCQVPYGVVHFDGSRIRKIEEKPEQAFLVNAGIYVLEPNVLDGMREGEYLDMPDLFQALIRAGGKTTVFPVREYWLDIGRIHDFQQAQADYETLFAGVD